MEIDLKSFNNELAESMKKPTPTSQHQEDEAIPSSPQPSPMERADDSSLAKELEELKDRHAEEIGQWKEYDRRIQEWKQQVQDVFQNLKKEIIAKQEMASELIKCRASLKLKEKEIGMLRSLIEKDKGKDFLEKHSDF
jgi:chromosome segregation ATPase